MSDIIDMLEDVNSTLKEEIVTLNKLTYIVDQQNEQGEGQKVSYKEAYESISEQHKNAMARIKELKAENERLETRNTELHDLIYRENGIAFTVDNDGVYIDGFGILPIVRTVQFSKT